jgi:hypothetical protein
MVAARAAGEYELEKIQIRAFQFFFGHMNSVLQK